MFLTKSIKVSVVETFLVITVLSFVLLPTPGWIEITRIIPEINFHRYERTMNNGNK